MPKKKVPSNNTQNAAFQFVVSCGPPHGPEDPAVRTLIRRQAMRGAGIERRGRKRGSERKGCDVQSWSLGEPPMAVSGFELGEERSDEQQQLVCSFEETQQYQQHRGVDDDDCLQDLIHYWTAPHHEASSLSCQYALTPDQGYQAARARFGIDLTTLSLLTGFSIGKTTIAQLAEDPYRMCSLVRDASPSSSGCFSSLSLIPARYGSSAVLTAAVDCLLAKARSVLVGSLSPRFERDAAGLYAKALRSLQGVIGDVETVGDADVLCAVQLLALHELLDPFRSTAWTHHISGSVRLMRHRTPRPFERMNTKSRCSKAMWAQSCRMRCTVIAIVCRSFVVKVNWAADCVTHIGYLAEPSWTALYESLIEESATHLTERHELVINVRKLIFPLPGLWHDISVAVRCNDHDEQSIAIVEELYLRSRDLQAAYLSWLCSYEQYCVSTALTIPTEQEIHLRREILGQALESLLIVDCLVATVSIDPSGKEDEIAALAGQIMELQDRPGPKHSWVFTGQEIGVAQVAIATKGLFAMDLSQSTAQERMSEMGRRYTTWSGLLRGC